MEERAPIVEDLNLLSEFIATVATVAKSCKPVTDEVAEELADA